MSSLIELLASVYETSNLLRGLFIAFLGNLTFHLTFYTLLGFFFTRKFKKTDKLHKYAIVIAARNEERVIGNLLDSIKRQDYPQEYVTVFVVADNCTDSTAEVARSKGAVCYERFDSQHRTKGYALQFLFENIKKDYGIEAFEGYFVFDADNLLNSDYITRMNEAFDSGEKIITSYRNTKNFDENWVSFSYAVHWLRSVRMRHRARSVLRLATNIQGTGFLFANELVRDGWNYTSLTEDRAFTADAVAHGYPISYCDAAVFYDEQPTSIKVAWRQRLRWSKGHLLAFVEIGPSLFKNIFVGNCYRDKTKKEPMSFKRFVEGVRQRWASYDVLTQCLPAVIPKLALWLLVSVFLYACFSYVNGLEEIALFTGSNNFSKVLRWIFGAQKVTLSPGIAAMAAAAGITVVRNAVGRINFHFKSMLISAYVLFMERKRIIKMPLYKKILYSITWPTFDAIGRWTTYFALFMKVEWKPIPHTSKVAIGDIERASARGPQKKIPAFCKILILCVPFIVMDVVIRVMSSGVNYFQWKAILPSVVFSVAWVALIICVSLFVKGRIGQILYGVFFTAFFVFYAAHLVYYPYSGFFFNYSLMISVGEGSSYLKGIIGDTPVYMFVLMVVALASGIYATVIFPIAKKMHLKKLLITLVAFAVIHTVTPMMYGSANSALEWDTWRNPRNVYDSFGDINKSLKVSGLYEFTVRNAWKGLTATEEEISEDEEKFLAESYTELQPHQANEYTGIFKDKNVIFLQLEGIDSWLLNETDMPTLYNMMNNSLVFNDHYSYYNGGGSTFNSEFAVATGFLTPITYSKNAYFFNNNSFPRSMPNLFKERGYTVNAFHMNTGEYYTREANYRNWGFDEYYSLIDDCGYTAENANLDTELINNELFYEKMFCQEMPFVNYVITYTPHTPFTLDGSTGKQLVSSMPDTVFPEAPGEEEVARMFAAETDRMIALMLKALEDNGLAENTVIVAFSDHYLYTLKDKTILDSYKTTENNLINETPFMIWSKDMEGKTFDKTNSQLDILPTVLNLFGFEYDDGYYIGNDILDPDYSGTVFFSDYSWYDGTHYVELGEVTNTDEYDAEYVESTNNFINTLIRRNDLTLKYNYLKNVYSEEK